MPVPSTPSPESISVRKGIAVQSVLWGLRKNHKIESIEDVRRIFQMFTEVSDIPSSYFDVITENDCYGVLATALRQAPISSTGTKLPSAMGFRNRPTPPKDMDEVDSHANRLGTHRLGESKANGVDRPTRPTYGDNEELEPFMLNIHHPVTGHYRLAKGSRCQGKENFISEALVGEISLQHLIKRGAIKLVVLYKNLPDPPKVVARKFWLVKDENIAHDIALGEEPAEVEECESVGSDEEEVNGSEPAQSPSQSVFNRHIRGEARESKGPRQSRHMHSIPRELINGLCDLYEEVKNRSQKRHYESEDDMVPKKRIRGEDDPG